MEGKRLRITRLDAEGQPIEGSTVEVGGVLGVGVEPGELFIPEGGWPEQMGEVHYARDFVFAQPDPGILNLLTGGGWEAHDGHHHSLDMHTWVPVRRRAWRVVWEWLTRKPRQYTEHKFHFPSVQVQPTGEAHEEAFDVRPLRQPPD